MKTRDLKQISDKYIFNMTAFKMLMLIAVMLTSVPYVHNFFGGYVKILLIYGYLILGYQLIKNNFVSALKDRAVWFLLAFCGSYAITILLNFKGNFMGDIKNLIYTGLFFTVFFMFNEKVTKDELVKEIKYVSALIVAGTFVLSLVSFVTYVFSLSGSYHNHVGIPVYYGMFENRLWGVFNPNTGSTISCISIVLSLIFIITDKRTKVRVMNWINIFLQYCVLLLTGSRAALYVLFLICAVLVFFYVINKAKAVNLKIVGAGVLACALSVVLLNGAGFILKEGLAYLPGITKNITYNVSVLVGISEESTQPEIEKTELDRIEESSNNAGGFFSGRTDIWGACFKEFCEDPFFGIGKENIIDRSIVNFKDNIWKEHFKQGGTHNIYLCILVSCGAVGFLIIAAFAVLTLSRALKTLVKSYKHIDFWFLGTFLICIMFYITEFVEARILFQVSIFSVVFWIYCGYMNKLARLETNDKN